jgi:hypothetical protein
VPFGIPAPGRGPLLSREQFHRYSKASDALLSCSASTLTPTMCARNWVDQVADIGGMNEEEKNLGLQMTIYYTEVLRMHGGNSAYCAADAKG